VPVTGATRVKNNFKGNTMDPKFFRKYADLIGEAGPVPAPAATTPPRPGAPATTPPAAKPTPPAPAAPKPSGPAPAGGNVPPNSPKQPTTAPGATPPASIGGFSQSANAKTGDVTKSFNAGDVSVSSTQTPGGYVKSQETSYQMGDTNVAQSKVAPDYAQGQLAAPTTTTATTGSGQQGTVVKGVGFGGASGSTVGQNTVTSGDQGLANMAKTMTQNQPVQEDDDEAEFQRLKEFLSKPY
jgi:hypothetical protein